MEAANCWVEDIMEQAEDVTRWGGAGAQLALPAPTSPAQVVPQKVPSEGS